MKNNKNKIKENFIKHLYKNLPKNNNPEYQGIINFASNGIENEIDAFNYGFRLGYTTHQNEIIFFLYSQLKKINKKNADKFFKDIALANKLSNLMLDKLDKVFKIANHKNKKYKQTYNQ